MKPCKVCNADKPAEDFRPGRRTCYACEVAIQLARPRKSRAKPKPPKPTHRLCTECLEPLADRHFSVADSAGRLRGRCKACEAKVRREGRHGPITDPIETQVEQRNAEDRALLFELPEIELAKRQLRIAELANKYQEGDAA
jgi:hypothetical protein